MSIIKEGSGASLALESLVDAHTLAAVLDALTEIARGKSCHLMVAWQDDPASDAWQEAAGALETAAVIVDKALKPFAC